MMFDGTQFVARPQVEVAQPYEGDAVLSPSATLEITRVANAANDQIGYVLRKVIPTPSGSSYTIQTPEIARYCVSGGKPAFSYDERWIVYHHYVNDADAQDLGFTGPSAYRNSDTSFTLALNAAAASCPGWPCVMWA